MLMPGVRDLQISLFKEEDVDLIMQKLPKLETLNNIPVESASEGTVEEVKRDSLKESIEADQLAKPVECQESEEILSERIKNDALVDQLSDSQKNCAEEEVDVVHDIFTGA